MCQVSGSAKGAVLNLLRSSLIVWEDMLGLRLVQLYENLHIQTKHNCLIHLTYIASPLTLQTQEALMGVGK